MSKLRDALIVAMQKNEKWGSAWNDYRDSTLEDIILHLVKDSLLPTPMATRRTR